MGKDNVLRINQRDFHKKQTICNLLKSDFSRWIFQNTRQIFTIDYVYLFYFLKSSRSYEYINILHIMNECE